ncbi:LexA family transcriptional regulator [uncultured Bacteroides sp.]|uniref:XRE family transcriptional regulator n=1 Tax=uncultured Bacteroides sp. TaxID=162156 RepID=UPI00258823FB|nr:LexA family transcriptional regulator [uncultured Bacteroides sp.]
MKKDVIDRITAFYTDKNWSQAEFAAKLNMEQKTVNNYLNRSRKPSFEFIDRVIRTFGLDANFFIFGSVEQNKDDNYPTEMVSNNKSRQLSARNAIKYYPAVSGSMGGVQFLDDPEESYVDIILPGFSECKYAINAYGDSMHPVIKSGQVVILMEWTERFIDWGRIYLVVTKTGYRTIKYLKPADNLNAIRCESENKELNPAFDIDKEDVLKLFLVKGWVCRDTI